MNCSKLGLVFAVALSFVTLAGSYEDLENSKDTSGNQKSAQLPESWVKKDDAQLDLNHRIGTLNPKSIDKRDVKMKKFNVNNDDNGAKGSYVGADADKGEKANQPEDSDLPQNYDVRKAYPQCPSLSSVVDQSNCANCWAVASASVFSDRICVQSNGKDTKQRSVENMLDCCPGLIFGDGCKGGSLFAALGYLVTEGIVTGGPYNSNEGCQPYSMPPCGGVDQPKCEEEPESSDCTYHCTNVDYPISYEGDIRKGKTTKCLGSVAVRIVGWCTENGTQYWFVENPYRGSMKVEFGTTILDMTAIAIEL